MQISTLFINFNLWNWNKFARHEIWFIKSTSSLVKVKWYLTDALKIHLHPVIKSLSLKPYITVWIDNGDPKLTNIVIVRGLHVWLNVRWKMKSKQMMKVHPLNLNSWCCHKKYIHYCSCNFLFVWGILTLNLRNKWDSSGKRSEESHDWDLWEQVGVCSYS